MLMDCPKVLPKLVHLDTVNSPNPLYYGYILISEANMNDRFCMVEVKPYGICSNEPRINIYRLRNDGSEQQIPVCARHSLNWYDAQGNLKEGYRIESAF